MNFKGRKLLLLIGDSADLLGFGRGAFKKQFRIIRVENGEKGVILAKHKHPDMIVSDVSIFNFDVLETCRLIKIDVETRYVPVILLGPEKDMINALYSGADDYILKPFNNDLLEWKIKCLIRFRDVLHFQHARAIFMGSGLNQHRGDLLEALNAVVSSNISDARFGINEIASLIDVSVSVLYRKVRMLTGITVNEYVKAIRMKRAMHLLESGTYQVHEVAKAVGFEDSKYFSREFRRTFGKNPVEAKSQRRMMQE